jgi:hypothetical protein
VQQSPIKYLSHLSNGTRKEEMTEDFGVLLVAFASYCSVVWRKRKTKIIFDLITLPAATSHQRAATKAEQKATAANLPSF